QPPEGYDHHNRNNVGSYGVDPRGLPGFEFDINENVGLRTDAKYLTSTMDTLRTLAEQTDGRAIVNRNDIAASIRQTTRDHSPYYLIGYNSAQAPADGKFHEIRVRVKRPGAQVRARKGYWALNAEQTARALAPPKAALPKPVENAIASVSARPSSASVVRTWLGTSRGDNGKTRVTFVWEPIPKTPGDVASSRSDPPARVSLMAVGADGSPLYRGKIDEHTVTFDVKPGKVQLRVSVEGQSSQVLDTEMRELTVPDLTGPHGTLGTPAVFRARTLRDYNMLKTDAAAVPIAAREFSRTDRILIRVPAYGPADTAPVVTAHLLNRAGQAMSEIPVAASPTPGTQQL